MRRLSKKVQNALEKIWPNQVAECLQKQACSYIGKRLADLNEKELIAELSQRGHQCKFS